MAETAILNPKKGSTPGTFDNYNPDYGFTRRTAQNSAVAKGRVGTWYQRDVLNAGHAFDLQWIARPWSTMLRLKQFYDNFKGGYFTYIDWDGGGRHHVGRFASEPNPVHVANNKYNVMGLVFEEIPQARMLTYPADFVHWGRTINVVDDSLVQAVATQGTWVAQINPTLFQPTSDPANYEVYNAAANLGDFAQFQYVGWGFQLNLRTSTAFGTCGIAVDGNVVASSIDISAAASFVNYQLTSLPLDVHRVKLFPTGQPGATSATGGPFGIAMPAIRVIV